MTRDDGATDLLDLHLSQVEDAPRRRRRTAWVLGALALVAVVTGVGIVAGAPHRPPATAEPSPPAAAPPSSAPTPTATEPDEPVVAEASLELSGHPAVQLTVGTGEPREGFAPPVVNFNSCGGFGKEMAYLPIEIRNPAPGLAAAVTVEPGPATAAGIGRLGFFFESNNGDAIPCRPGAAWPTTDTFKVVNGASLITGYVVLDQGRPDVFSTLQLKISNLRQFDNYDVPQPLTVATVTVGQLCPGDQDAVCAPLG